MSGGELGLLEPEPVWRRFLELTRIPRPPKEEDRIRSHVLDWATAHGYRARSDEAGNVLVKVPASPGRDEARVTVLQAHLDMVCERDPGSPYDAREGRIEVVFDGEWVAAEGTTLGADNGIGVAAAMAAADDPGLAHGPLELLFTVSEEQGLVGAKGLDPKLVSGRLLINLDGTDDKGITVGCAGSTHARVSLSLPVEPLSPDGMTLEVAVAGVRGGHSGGDIARGRINAIKALGRVLGHAHTAAPFRLARLEGGASRNAIPRDAHALVSLSPSAEPLLREAAQAALAALENQYEHTDPDVSLAIGERPSGNEAWSEAASGRALDLVQALPTGVLAMSAALPGIVETSTSLGVARTVDGVLTLTSMTRSSSSAALADAVASIEAVARLADAEVEVVPSYPPWQPDLDSDLLRVAVAAFLRLFAMKAELTVVHGGLECAVIGDKLPGVEMVSIGPEIQGPHAPGERVSVPGTQRFYRLLGALLDDLSR